MVDTRGVVRLGMPSNEKPKMGELNKFLTEYCKQWKSIGYKLGLEDAVLNMIQGDYSTQRESFTAALQKWLEQDTQPTWNTLELAITNARREELSLEVLLEMPVQPSNGHSKPKQVDDKRQEKKFAVQEQKSISTSDLSVHFSTFVMTIRKMLEKCADKLALCKEICSNLTIGDSDILLFNDEQLDKVNKCTSFQQLFAILRKHWSWKEYSLLKTIITECDSEEAEVELDKFEKLMSSFYGMKLISDTYAPSELPENYVKLCITIDKPYKSLTLQDFYKLRTFIFEHLDVQKYITLPFIKFLFSSLHLEWYIPMQAVSHIIKMVRLNKNVLIQNSIVLIEIGDKSILDVQSRSPHNNGQLDKPVGFASSFPISKEHGHIVCPLCNELFKNPKYLSCYHSYCEQCLEKMQKNSEITCLKCTYTTVVPEGGVKGLPNNYFMDNLVKKLILHNQLENVTQLRCEECDKDYPVVVYCTDCKLFLCCYCKEAHKYSKSYCSHNLISLTELRTNKDLIKSKIKFPTCQEHNLKLKYYCESCEKLICVQCTEEHQDHKYDVVEKVVNKYQNELKEVTVPIEIMIEDLSKLHDSINGVKTAIQQQGDKISKDIDLYYDEVIEKLLEQKQQVKQQVNNTISQKEATIEQQVEEVMCAQKDVLNAKRLRDTIQDSTYQEILSVKNQLLYSLEGLREKCKKLSQKPIEPVNIRVSPGNGPLPQYIKHSVIIDSLYVETNSFSKWFQQDAPTVLDVATKDNKGDYYPREGYEGTVQLEQDSPKIVVQEIETSKIQKKRPTMDWILKETHLMCPVCCQLFNNPKFLPCFHSYCEQCLEKLQVQSKIICPECRHEATVPLGGVKLLQSNFFVNWLVAELVNKCAKEDDEEVQCDNCDKNDLVIAFCLSCSSFLCKVCYICHKQDRTTHNHTTVVLSEIITVPDQTLVKTLQCREYGSNELPCYCETCYELICMYCTIKEHSGHNDDTVKKMATECRHKMNKNIATIENMFKDLSKLHGDIEMMLTKVKNQGDEVIKEIHERCATKVDVIMEQRDKMEQQVHTIVSEKVKALTLQLEGLNSVHSKQTHVLHMKELIDFAKKSSNPDEILLSIQKQFASFTKQLMEVDVKLHTQPVESDTIQFFTDETFPQFGQVLSTVEPSESELSSLPVYAFQGVPVEFVITAKYSNGCNYPRGGNQISVQAQLQSQSGNMENMACNVRDNKDGSYMATFTAQQTGRVKLSLFLDGQQIKDSPHSITVDKNYLALSNPTNIVGIQSHAAYVRPKPWGIAFGQNNLWAVADWNNHCVHVFYKDGQLLWKFGSKGFNNGQLDNPCGIAFDGKNHLYVADYNNHRVQKFDINGNYLLQFSGKESGNGRLSTPVDVIVHKERVYVADSTANCIVKFYTNGQFCQIIGKGYLNNPNGVTVNCNNHLLVTNLSDDSVYIFTLDGQYLGKFGASGTKTGQLSCPRSITSDPNGFILVTDTCNHRISIFDNDGKYVHCFGSKGKGKNQFLNPQGIALAPNGCIYISDNLNGCIKIFEV